MTRVCGIIVNLVPYHHARWGAFTRLSGAECHLLELTRRDAFRVLEYSAAASYQRHTLFPNDGGETNSAPAVRRAVASKLDALRPDMVCVSGWALPVSLSALAWAARNRVPAVMLSESNEFDAPRPAHKEWIKRRIVALCSAGLAGGTPEADYLAKLGLPRDRIFVGYDVVDNGYFAKEGAEVRSQKSEVRSKHGLPINYFLACCRFGRKKNVPRLIEAYARYRELCANRQAESVSTSDLRPRTSTPWDLVVAGDGEERPAIEAAIARCGVGASVHLAGAKSYAEIPMYYGLASTFVHASTTEQWGLVVNEAMASGLPVLVSNRCGCATDLVRDGVNGFTFDPCNIGKLAELMLKISSLNHLLSTFGGRSRDIIANWGPERFACGLKAAVDKAQEVGPKGAGMVDRLILRGLSLR